MSEPLDLNAIERAARAVSLEPTECGMVRRVNSVGATPEQTLTLVKRVRELEALLDECHGSLADLTLELREEQLLGQLAQARAERDTLECVVGNLDSLALRLGLGAPGDAWGEAAMELLERFSVAQQRAELGERAIRYLRVRCNHVECNADDRRLIAEWDALAAGKKEEGR